GVMGLKVMLVRLLGPKYATAKTFGSNWLIAFWSAFAVTTNQFGPFFAMPEECWGSRSCLNVVCCSVRRSCAGFKLCGPPAACSVRAPTEAACGAAAVVPEKFGSVSGPCAASLGKKGG